MKEARSKRLHTEWFHLYEIVQAQHYEDAKQSSGFQELGEGVEANYQGLSQGVVFRVV